MPYASKERKREWERTHRAERSAAFLSSAHYAKKAGRKWKGSDAFLETAHFERKRRRLAALKDASERAAWIDPEDPEQAGSEEWRSYEAALEGVYGPGNPLDDTRALRWIRKHR